MSPTMEALIAAARERLHRSIAQKTRRAQEALTRKVKAMRLQHLTETTGVMP